MEETEDSEFISEKTLSENAKSDRRHFKGFVELLSGDTFGILGLMDEKRSIRKLAVRTIKPCHILVVD